MSASSAVATTARARLPSSSAMPTCNRMRRPSPTDRAGPSLGRVVEIPMRCSSSTVPRTATRSPRWSGWSRPGHISIGSPPLGMIATGARWPKWARKVSCMFSLDSTPSCTTAKSTPASSMAWAGRSRQASTKDGAASEATSSTLPGPDTRSRALATDGLASCTTRGRSGRISLMRSAVSRVWISSTSTQTTAAAWASPASSNPSPLWACRRTCGTPQSLQGAPAAGIGVVVDHDDRGAAEGELLDGAQPDALQAADDHVALHVSGVLAVHQRMLSFRIGVEVAAALNVGVLAQRGLEPPWGCSSVVRAGDS